VLADELAEAVANLWAGAVSSYVLWRTLLRWDRSATDLFDRADADSIGFAQSAIDGARFGNSHLGATHEWRNVGWIGVTITNKSSAGLRFVNRSLKSPALG
jgi:hypothetical protein